MRKKWMFWWGANLFWLITFIIGSAIIWLRTIDGAVQTPEIKLFSFLILLVFYSIPAFIQVEWLIDNLVTNSNRSSSQ